MKLIGVYVFIILMTLFWYAGIDYGVRGFVQAYSIFVALLISIVAQILLVIWK